MELANTLKPIPRKRFLKEMGMLGSLPADKNIPPKHPGEEEYEKGMSFCRKHNYHEALPFFEKAASLKYPPAFIRLKIIYEEWNDSEKAKIAHDQCTEYAPWFVEQTQRGDMNAEYNLALYYYEISKDYKQAFDRWRNLARKGHDAAQNHIGLCYQNGEGVEKNLIEAFRWFSLAADQGYADALFNFGFCHEFGKGVEKDPSQAWYWYQKAADQGHVMAQYNLGVCYYNGEGVEKDLSQAVYWYQKAAKQGYAMAQYNLGLCYTSGTGITKDDATAMYWYKKAAEQKYPASMYTYGMCFENGQGVVKNYKEASMWYQLAADMGYEKANVALKNLRTHS